MKSLVRILTIVTVVAGCAGLADAKPHFKWWRARRILHRRRIIRRLPLRRAIVPPRVIVPVKRPTVVTVPSVVKVKESAPAAELKAEIATLKAKYSKLDETRQNLRNWLAGAGKDAAATERAKVLARLAKVNSDCTAVATQIAELETKLAEL